MLAWFNEDPATLHRAVSSLTVIADRLVAADGGWDLYPDASLSSPPEQAQAIQEACDQAGIQLDLYPGQKYTGQVAKRQFMLNRAAGHSDWVMPLDADWELQGHRDQIRAQLDRSQADALIVPLYTPPNHKATLHDVAATTWHEELAGRTVYEPLIYRALPNMRVEKFHWCYSGIRDGKRVSLWGHQHQPQYQQAVTHSLMAPMQINHWCLHRDQRTILANREYCEQRARHVAYHGKEP